MTTHLPTIPQPSHARLPIPGRRAALSGWGGCLIFGLLLSACTTQQASHPSLPKPSAPYSKATFYRPNLLRPAEQTRTNSRVTVAVRPLGAVPFDFAVLPLTSPDGRFIAAQHGLPPPWPALLAESGPDARLPHALQISAFKIDLTPTAAASPISPVPWPDPLPRGLLLGRSCDDQGFLVESPRPDASRWIGKVDWLTGKLDWIVNQTPVPSSDEPPPPPTVAAFATLGPTGQIAYSRRRGVSGPFDLIVRTAASDPSTETVLASANGESIVCPTFSADRTRVYALALPADPNASMAIIAISLADPHALSITSRADLHIAPSIAAAYQTVAALQTPWPLPPQADLRFSAGIALLSGASLSMVWFDAASGTLTPMARGTIGAAPFIAPNGSTAGIDAGFLLGAARELVFQPLVSHVSTSTTRVLTEFGAEVSVITGPYLPRLATASQPDGRPWYLLLSPPRAGGEATVGVLVLSPVP